MSLDRFSTPQPLIAVSRASIWPLPKSESSHLIHDRKVAGESFDVTPVCNLSVVIDEWMRASCLTGSYGQPDFDLTSILFLSG